MKSFSFVCLMSTPNRLSSLLHSTDESVEALQSLKGKSFCLSALPRLPSRMAHLAAFSGLRFAVQVNGLIAVSIKGGQAV